MPKQTQFEGFFTEPLSPLNNPSVAKKKNFGFAVKRGQCLRATDVYARAHAHVRISCKPQTITHSPLHLFINPTRRVSTPPTRGTSQVVQPNMSSERTVLIDHLRDARRANRELKEQKLEVELVIAARTRNYFLNTQQRGMGLLSELETSVNELSGGLRGDDAELQVWATAGFLT